MKRCLLTICILLILAFLFTPCALAAGTPVRIAIIDTGISSTAISPENIGTGRNYILPQDDTEDKLGHGTAVSAIIVGSQKARIESLCPTAILIPLVYASKNENGQQVNGDTGTVAQAIYDAVDIYNCDIINISSGAAIGSDRLQQAVEYAARKGVLVVSCAGNDQEDNPGSICYPGGYESVLCVGSANSDGTIAYFSQQNAAVDLLALGTDLRLASIKGTRIRGEGTSFSTAIVTGVAAQIMTIHPELTADEVRNVILSTTRTVAGWQVLDTEAALSWQPNTNTPETQPTINFPDVVADAYYYEAVIWAAQNKVTGGTSNGTFAPDTPCTRAQMAAFLWRAAGAPESVGGSNPFVDIPADAYYADAVQWAFEQDITGGTTANTFSPDAPCTRGQMATFLCRMLKGEVNNNTGTFTDVAANAYYADAVQWAAENNITQGTSATTFSPDEVCSRAQIVTFLYRSFVK